MRLSLKGSGERVPLHPLRRTHSGDAQNRRRQIDKTHQPVRDAPHYDLGEDISGGLPGTPWFVKGKVRTTDGTPIPNATIEVWQADEAGFYDVQKPGLDNYQGRAIIQADAQGLYHFKSIVPECYPIPHDGPVGKMLEALNRHPWRPAHLHFMITAPGFQRLVTHVFREGGDYLDSDAVFGVRSSLIADWVRHESGIDPYGKEIDSLYYTLDFDFILHHA